MASELTRTEILAGASEILERGGYTRIPSPAGWPEAASRLFEDEFGVVAVFAYDTWPELREAWPKAQGLLVELISRHLRSDQPKAWDGYLVLLTPDAVSSGERKILEAIRYDTGRVRKIVAAGGSLEVLADLREILMTLSPLVPGDSPVKLQSPLELLPHLLQAEGIPPRLSEVLLEAHQRNTPLMEALHQYAKRVEHED